MNLYHDKNSYAGKRWTPSAVHCYEIGGRCSKCYIKDILGTKCRMKQTIIELVRVLGAPIK